MTMSKTGGIQNPAHHLMGGDGCISLWTLGAWRFNSTHELLQEQVQLGSCKAPGYTGGHPADLGRERCILGKRTYPTCTTVCTEEHPGALHP